MATDIGLKIEFTSFFPSGHFTEMAAFFASGIVNNLSITCKNVVEKP